MLQEPQDDQVCEYSSTCLTRPSHNCDQCRRDVCPEHYSAKSNLCITCLAQKLEHEEFITREDL